MKILVDHRERGQIPNVKRVRDEIETVHLPLGDYLILSENGAVLVERKTFETSYTQSGRTGCGISC